MTVADATSNTPATAAYINTLVAAINRSTYTNLSTSTTLTTDHQVVAVSTTSGSVTITLPSAVTVGAGWQYTIKRTDSSANVLTINTTSGEAVDSYLSGDAGMKLYVLHSAITVMSDGGNWKIVSRARSDKRTWTPTFDVSGGGFAIGSPGNVTSGWYLEDGPMIEGCFYVTLGTGPTLGTGNYRITLPVTAVSNNTYGTMGHGLIFDSSTGLRYVTMLEQDGGTSRVLMSVQGGTTASTTSPVVPAVGDNYRGYFRYHKG